MFLHMENNPIQYNISNARQAILHLFSLFCILAYFVLVLRKQNKFEFPTFSISVHIVNKSLFLQALYVIVMKLQRK